MLRAKLSDRTWHFITKFRFYLQPAYLICLPPSISPPVPTKKKKKKRKRGRQKKRKRERERHRETQRDRDR